MSGSKKPTHEKNLAAQRLLTDPRYKPKRIPDKRKKNLGRYLDRTMKEHTDHDE
jgi:hypothetical protein